MQVRARVGFVGIVAGQSRAVRAGEVFDLPGGVDWLRAGLVVPVLPDAPGPETASVEPRTAAAVLPDGKRKRKPTC